MPKLLSPFVALSLQLVLVLAANAQVSQVEIPTGDNRQDNGNLQASPSVQDEFWFASARDAICCNTVSNEFTTRKKVNGVWCPSQTSDLVTAHANDRCLRTVIYVHGWRTDAERAVTQAMKVYQALRGGYDRPIRFVIVAWRAEKTKKRFKNDYVEKSNSAVQLGRTFSDFLATFGDRDISLIGHSLGSQLILSSLTQESKLAETTSKYRVCLTAPAINCQFGHCIEMKTGCFQDQTEKTIVVNGCPDKVLWLGNKIVCELDKWGEVDFRALVNRNNLPLGEICWYNTTDTNRKHDVGYYVRTREFQFHVSELLESDCGGESVAPILNVPPADG